MSTPNYPLQSVTSRELVPERNRELRKSHPVQAALSGRAAPAQGEADGLPIIAICHLSWDWVWQRPQQFLSRMARTHPLLFVETHCSDTQESFMKLSCDSSQPGLRIAQLHLPKGRWPDAKFIDRERRRLLQEWLATPAGSEFREAILWINDPMAVIAYAGHLGERLIVYDCMDELSQFSGAPPELIEREWELVAIADVIFCGGQKMRAKRLPYNPNTHFYGTGVDCDHFGSVVRRRIGRHPEVAALPGPVLGYFGVIDERIDYDLLAQLAEANPSWSIAMVGPSAKVDPGVLPRYPNLHWMGPKSYGELPCLTAGMDVCMMPFALNKATEYINPTKALEYMAAGKPVVSTALDEVRLNFGSVALIADSVEEFIQHCWEQVAEPCSARIRRGLDLASENTWESIVSKMNGHFGEALRRKPASFRESATLCGEPREKGTDHV